MFRTQKHQDFISDPIIKYKSVESIPGITVVSGGHLKEAGFGSAASILNQFLVLKQNERLFTEWLRSVAGVNANYASMCYNGLKEWHDVWGKEYGFKPTPVPTPPPPVIRRQKSSTPSRFDERSSTPKFQYEQNNMFVDFFVPHDRNCRALHMSSNSLMDLTRDPWQRLNNNESKRLSMPKCLNALQDKNFNYFNLPKTTNSGLAARSTTSRSSHSRSLTPEHSIVKVNNNLRGSSEKFEKTLSATKPFITSVKEFIRGGSGTDRQTSFESSTISIDSIEENGGANQTSDEEKTCKGDNQENDNDKNVKKSEDQTDAPNGETKPLQRGPTFILDSEAPEADGKVPEDEVPGDAPKTLNTQSEVESVKDTQPQQMSERTGSTAEAKERNSLSASTTTSDGSKISNSNKNVRYADIDLFDDRQDIRNIKPTYEKPKVNKETRRNNLTTSLNSKVRGTETKTLTSCLSRTAQSSVSTPNLNAISPQGLSSTNRKSALKNSKPTSKSTVQLRSSQNPQSQNQKASHGTTNLKLNVRGERNSTGSRLGKTTERNIALLKRSSTSVGEHKSKSSDVNYKNSSVNTTNRSTRRPRMSNQDSGVFMNSKRFNSTDATTDSDLDSTTLSGSIASYQIMSKSANNLDISNGCESSTNFANENSANEVLDGNIDWSERDELECITSKRRNVRLFCDLLSSEMEQLPLHKIRTLKTKILQLVYSEIEEYETEQNSQC